MLGLCALDSALSFPSLELGHIEGLFYYWTQNTSKGMLMSTPVCIVVLRKRLNVTPLFRSRGKTVVPHDLKLPLKLPRR